MLTHSIAIIASEAWSSRSSLKVSRSLFYQLLALVVAKRSDEPKEAVAGKSGGA